MDRYAIDCGLSTSSVTINYGFGGSGGPVIAVPFSELVGEPVLDNNNQPETMPDGNAACSFGMSRVSYVVQPLLDRTAADSR